MGKMIPPLPVGHVSFRLTIVDNSPLLRKYGQLAYACLCACGKPLLLTRAAVRTGGTRSCGCLNRDNQSARLRKLNTTHGLTGTPTYEVWQSMKSRCLRRRNKEWANYGGRGIKICDRWLGRDGFANFLADMGEKPEGMSIERGDVDGNYEPGNCRWATTEEQGFNKRTGRMTLADVDRLVAAQTEDEVRGIATELGVTSRYANGARRKKARERGIEAPLFRPSRARSVA